MVGKPQTPPWKEEGDMTEQDAGTQSTKRPGKFVEIIATLLAPFGLKWAQEVLEQIERAKRAAADAAKDAGDKVVAEATGKGEAAE